MKKIRKSVIAALTVALAAIGLAVSPPLAVPAQAASVIGGCPRGAVCFYYSPNEMGPYYPAFNSIADLNTVNFISTNIHVRNNAHSVCNNTSVTVVVFYYPGYSYAGPTESLAPGFCGNFIPQLVNNEASVLIPPPGAVCPANSFCLYYAAGETGSFYAITEGSHIPNLYNEKFTGPGAGQNSAVGRNAHSYRNNLPAGQCATVFSGLTYSGYYQTTFCSNGTSSANNLPNSLINNELSVSTG